MKWRNREAKARSNLDVIEKIHIAITIGAYFLIDFFYVFK